jgi:hypothetical protein
MALVAAVKLLNEHPDRAIGGICTFGSRWSGTNRFAARLDQRLPGRFVRSRPPRTTFRVNLRAARTAERWLYFDRNGGLHENPGRFERLWDSMWRDSARACGRIIRCASTCA